MVITGRVVRGEGYGKILGFPTANINRRQYATLKKKPKLGVWAGLVRIEDQKQLYPAGIVIGPLDQNQLPKLEAHLIDFRRNLYGKKLEFHLIKYLRPFKKYRGEKNLKEQISKDIIKIHKLKSLWKN